MLKQYGVGATLTLIGHKIPPQVTVIARLTGIQRLFKCIQHEVRGHRRTDPPADDAASKHVDHERHVQPALPRRYVGEVRHPKLIRPVGLELPVVIRLEFPDRI